MNELYFDILNKFISEKDTKELEEKFPYLKDSIYDEETKENTEYNESEKGNKNMGNKNARVHYYNDA